jgi:hypothetical protein
MQPIVHLSQRIGRGPIHGVPKGESRSASLPKLVREFFLSQQAVAIHRRGLSLQCHQGHCLGRKSVLPTERGHAARSCRGFPTNCPDSQPASTFFVCFTAYSAAKQTQNSHSIAANTDSTLRAKSPARQESGRHRGGPVDLTDDRSLHGLVVSAAHDGGPPTLVSGPEGPLCRVPLPTPPHLFGLIRINW